MAETKSYKQNPRFLVAMWLGIAIFLILGTHLYNQDMKFIEENGGFYEKVLAYVYGSYKGDLSYRYNYNGVNYKSRWGKFGRYDVDIGDSIYIYINPLKPRYSVFCPDSLNQIKYKSR